MGAITSMPALSLSPRPLQAFRIPHGRSVGKTSTNLHGALRPPGASPAAEAPVAAHLVGDSALALAQGGAAALVGAEDVEAPLAVADNLRVEEHKGVVPASSCFRNSGQR